MRKTYPTEMWQDFLKEVNQIGRSPITNAGVIRRTMSVDDGLFASYLGEVTKAGLDVNKMDFIFEFGPGHGRLCKVLLERGFKGKYILFDLPDMIAMQQRFLVEVGVNLDNVVFLSDLDALPEPAGNSLFISMSALEEAPVEIMYEFLTYAHKYRNFIFKFSGHAGDFEKFAQDKQVKWSNADQAMGRPYVYMRIGVE